MINVLFAVSEIEGIVKTGGLADVARFLPRALNHSDCHCVVAIPHYQAIDNHPLLQTQIGALTTCKTFPLSLSNQETVNIIVRSFLFDGTTVLTFAIDDLFNRSGLYDCDYQAFSDNGLRFGLFSLAISEMFDKYSDSVNFKPDIIHCNDWHTGLLAAFTKQNSLKYCKSVVTIHNGAFQGEFDVESLGPILQKLPTHIESKPSINFLKIAIQYCDQVVAVSPNYATELLSDLGSHDLKNTFARCSDKLVGILNGCDYSLWDPSCDTNIKFHYDSNNIKNKQLNKHALQQWAGLPTTDHVPVFTQVSRLTEQKGMAYLIPALEDILEHPVQIIIIGSGDPIYVEQLQDVMLRYPDKFYFFHGFTEALNHQAIAGADFFLIPSLFEPCGLTQMHALAFGNVPIARKVGGLKDTVTDINDTHGNGVLFEQPEVASLSSALRRAILIYLTNKPKLKAAQVNGMKRKFLWDHAAKSYQSLYKQLLSI